MYNKIVNYRIYADRPHPFVFFSFIHLFKFWDLLQLFLISIRFFSKTGDAHVLLAVGEMILSKIWSRLCKLVN